MRESRLWPDELLNNLYAAEVRSGGLLDALVTAQPSLRAVAVDAAATERAHA